MGKLRFAIAALVAFSAPAAHGGQGRIGVGEVTAQAASRDDVDVAALRRMVEEAVGTIDAGRLPRSAGVVLSVSLVRLDSRATPSADVSCLVSATLRDGARGSVFAVVEGSARGHDEPRRIHTLERATMRAAVTSAIARVPEAMSHRRR